MSSQVETEDRLVEPPVENTMVDADPTKEGIPKDQVPQRRGVSARLKLIYLGAIFMFALLVLVIASFQNPGIYEIDKETLITINQSFNALVLLVIPFLLGMLGAVSRILIAGVKLSEQISLVISSGLMATFSWIGIKSGVLLSIVAPHLEIQGVETSAVISSPSDFYTMALVAIFVGMFSTNLYLFINQKVEQLTNQSRQENPSKKNQTDT